MDGRKWRTLGRVRAPGPDEWGWLVIFVFPLVSCPWSLWKPRATPFFMYGGIAQLHPWSRFSFTFLDSFNPIFFWVLFHFCEPAWPSFHPFTTFFFIFPAYIYPVKTFSPTTLLATVSRHSLLPSYHTTQHTLMDYFIRTPNHSICILRMTPHLFASSPWWMTLSLVARFLVIVPYYAYLACMHELQNINGSFIRSPFFVREYVARIFSLVSFWLEQWLFGLW